MTHLTRRKFTTGLLAAFSAAGIPLHRGSGADAVFDTFWNEMPLTFGVSNYCDGIVIVVHGYNDFGMPREVRLEPEQ
jgi:hypothetical protein